MLLTPFAFEKILEEYEYAEKVSFLWNSDDFAVTYSQGETGHTVTTNSCTCMHFSAMSLPCRHLLRYLNVNQLDVYAENLCDKRWTRAYYYNSHPALNNITNKELVPTVPISFSQMKLPAEIDKFKKTAAITKDINNCVSNMSNAEFSYFYEKVKDLRDEITLPNRGNATSISHTTTSAAIPSTLSSAVIRPTTTVSSCIIEKLAAAQPTTSSPNVPIPSADIVPAPAVESIIVPPTNNFSPTSMQRATTTGTVQTHSKSQLKCLYVGSSIQNITKLQYLQPTCHPNRSKWFFHRKSLGKVEQKAVAKP